MTRSRKKPRRSRSASTSSARSGGRKENNDVPARYYEEWADTFNRADPDADFTPEFVRDVERYSGKDIGQCTGEDLRKAQAPYDAETDR